ncbi:hypothetical protein K438DRAFT_1882113 [Mycena galopus ATCC 62051]|nr:hypothetical protein K438DRAFT_1882113 [Mycena galopus ATCC 62051]
MVRPSLPEKLDALDEAQQSKERELHRRRLVHYHYVKGTAGNNELHYTVVEPIGMFRRQLFIRAGELWDGETLELKVELIRATKNWEELTGEGLPCPVVFDPRDVRETMELDVTKRKADETLEVIQDAIGFGWVPAERYEEVLARTKQLKKDALTAVELEEELAQVAAHWLWDDMDEKEYL